MIKACIFDLDGTIIDSEPNYYLSDKKIVKRYGGHFTPAMHQSFVGVGAVNFLNWLKMTYNVSIPLPDLIEEKDKYYLKYARKNTRVFPQMQELINSLKTSGFPMALATGSSRNVAHQMLEWTGLLPFFKVIITSEEVQRGKPAPDIFLAAAKMLQSKPEECLVFEDSVYGVQAAVEAGMFCCAIPSFVHSHELSSWYYKASLLFPQGIETFDPKKVLDFIQSHNSSSQHKTADCITF